MLEKIKSEPKAWAISGLITGTMLIGTILIYVKIWMILVG